MTEKFLQFIILLLKSLETIRLSNVNIIWGQFLDYVGTEIINVIYFLMNKNYYAKWIMQIIDLQDIDLNN